MTQADAILAKFKAARVSQGLLSRTMGCGQTTVAGWKKRGFIPAPQQPQVLEAATALGVVLTPDDFFPPFEASEAA